MMINEAFLTFFLVWVFIRAVLLKDNMMPNKLEDIAIKIKFSLLKELSSCLFCMGFWIAFFMSMAWAIYIQDIRYLVWSVYSVSLGVIFKI